MHAVNRVSRKEGRHAPHYTPLPKRGESCQAVPMFAPPALVANLAARSPRIRALPMATQRQIAASCGDVNAAGDYVVTGAPSGVMMHTAASRLAASLGTLSDGDVVIASGAVDNGFAYVRVIGTTGTQDGWVSQVYLAPTTLQAGSPAPAGADLAPGDYAVRTSGGTGVTFREAPSTDAVPIRNLPDRTVVTATGENVNFFAQVSTGGVTGWAAAVYLVPVSSAPGVGGLELTPADVLQLRTILTAWSHATPGAPAYGLPTDLVASAAAAARQEQIVTAFQQWHGGLRTDGVVDAPTQAAVLGWAQNAVAGGPPPGGIPIDHPGPNQPPPVQLPPLPPPPGPAPPPAKAKPPGGIPIVLIVGGAVVGGLLLLEQKKKKKKAAS